MTRDARRQFLQDVTLGSAAALAVSRALPLAARQATAGSPWRSRIGLGCTVRDRLTTDYEGTLAKVAEIGYTEVEPTSYNNMSPKDFRAMLDRLKLTMPSAHAPARGTGVDLERQLEGFQVMGIKYRDCGGWAGRGAATLDAPAGDPAARWVFRRRHRPRSKRVQGNRGVRAVSSRPGPWNPSSGGPTSSTRTAGSRKSSA